MAETINFNQVQTPWQSVQDAFEKNNSMQDALLNDIDTAVSSIREKDIASINAVHDNRLQTVKNQIDSMSIPELLQLDLQERKEELRSLGGLGGTEKTFEDVFSDLQQYQKDRIKASYTEAVNVQKAKVALDVHQNEDIADTLTAAGFDFGAKDAREKLPEFMKALRQKYPNLPINDTTDMFLQDKIQQGIAARHQLTAVDEQVNKKRLATLEADKLAYDNLVKQKNDEITKFGYTSDIYNENNDFGRSPETNAAVMRGIVDTEYGGDVQVTTTLEDDEDLFEDGWQEKITMTKDGKRLSVTDKAQHILAWLLSGDTELDNKPELNKFKTEKFEQIQAMFSDIPSDKKDWQPEANSLDGRFLHSFKQDAIAELDKQIDFIATSKDLRGKVVSSASKNSSVFNGIPQDQILQYKDKSGKVHYVGALDTKTQALLAKLKEDKYRWQINPPSIKKDTAFMSTLMANVPAIFTENGKFRNADQLKAWMTENVNPGSTDPAYVAIKKEYLKQLNSRMAVDLRDLYQKHSDAAAVSIKENSYLNEDIFKSGFSPNTSVPSYGRGVLFTNK